MEQTIKERLVSYLKIKQMGQNKFESIAGISNGYISNLKSTPGSVILTKILNAAPDLNQQWLLTGEGEMLNNGNQDEQEYAVSESNPIQYSALPVWADAFVKLLTEQVKQNEELHRELKQSIVEVNELKDVLKDIIKQLRRK